VYLNYPNNPTTAIAPLDYLERTVAICRRHDIVLAYDNPYCELTFDGYRAPSIFEVDGARDVAIEFHSLSKSFGLTGWRLGWAVGRKELIGALARVKTFIDTGPLLAVQAAGAAVLDQAEALIPPVVAEYARRRDAGVEALGEAGFPVARPRATMYLWVPLPEGVRSADFAWGLVDAEAVLVLHGSSFGRGGEGYCRIALTVAPDRLREAARRLQRSGVLQKVGSATA